MNGAPLTMSVARMVAGLEGARIIGPSERTVAAIVHDSRAVRPGSVYVALPGTRVDGHAFVAEALAAGASTIVVDAAHAALAERAGEAFTAVIVPQTSLALSRFAATFYANPSAALDVVGITGTNGKTTTACLVAAILDGAGIAAGRIGTLGAEFGGHEWPLANTTPLALELQALLAAMRARGARAVAMEVSSHALALERVADVRFACAVLTNITRDHLDFHGSVTAYAAAKRRLFDSAPHAILNRDDPSGAAWARELPPDRRTTYGIDTAADVHAGRLEMAPRGSTFVVDGQRFVIRLPGRFNVANALAAIAVARRFDVEDRESARILAAYERVPGRMEHIGGDDVDVIVDYAHTPDALANVLSAARDACSGRVIAVFGCGGDRDRGKRPEMGRIAHELADRAIVTSDNPRGEAPQAIIDEIVAGLAPSDRIAVEPDRRRAIRLAIAEAAPGDVVVIAGKGHETDQITGDERVHFDDREEAAAALRERSRAGERT
jgi:UDP-N-acetylmuramoyl-L-alanyl-D-glutamate--2,6-diaminopimelate ligase